MKNVIIIENQKYLDAYLRRTAVTDEARRFFSWQILGDESSARLTALNFRQLKKPNFPENFKNRFIEAYAGMIVALTRVNNNRVWLASDAASKNRFSSELPFLLEKLFLIEELIKTESFDTLLVVGQPWATWRGLEAFCKGEGIRIAFLGSRIGPGLNLVNKKIRGWGAIVTHAFVVAYRGSYARKVMKGRLAALKGRTMDYVLKTHVYDKSSPKNEVYQDAFFGQLPRYLKDKNEIFLLVNVIGNFKKCLQDFLDCRSYTLIPYEAFITLKDLVLAMGEALFRPLRIPEGISFLDQDVTSILKRSVIAKIQFRQYLHYECTKNLFEVISAKRFVMTYENYPWERMCILALREKDPAIQIIGYQHTVVPQAFLNMFIGPTEKGVVPLPDRILTTGEATRSIIEQYSSLDPIRIDAACGLRFEYLFEKRDLFPQRKIRNILVALEIGYEQYEIVQYLLKELKDMPHLDIRIRAHPNFPWRRYAEKFDCDLNRYPHFKDSGANTIQADLQWADVIIYSGTTVGLEGLIMGKPIIHFDRGAILSFDPLFQCDDLKWTITTADSFKKIIEQINGLSAEDFQKQQQQAKQYTRRYFFPMEERNLEKFAG